MTRKIFRRFLFGAFLSVVFLAAAGLRVRFVEKRIMWSSSTSGAGVCFSYQKGPELQFVAIYSRCRERGTLVFAINRETRSRYHN